MQAYDMDDDLLMTLEPDLNRIPILKPSLEDNLILLQTPVQKNLKVNLNLKVSTDNYLKNFNLESKLLFNIDLELKILLS